MKDIVILGVGGFAREILTLIKDINKQKLTWNILGFIDNDAQRGSIINGYPVFGNDNDLLSYSKPLSVAVAFGDPKLKMKVQNKLSSNLNLEFPAIIHPGVIIGDSEYVKIGKGCIVCAGNILTTNIELKDFVTLNLMCTVGHDTVIGNYSTFMPSVNISGEVSIEDKVYVGTGAKIINQLSIGEYTIVGAGAVVSKSLPAKCTAVGVPAKPIKYHE